MSQALQLGPLILPFPVLLAMGSGLVTFAVGRWRSKASDAVDTTLWVAVLAGLAVARLAFVWEYRPLYVAAPLTVLDIRDGGWNPTAGLVAAWAVAWHRGRQAPATASPLRWALGIGSSLFVAGSVFLSALGATGVTLPPLAFASLDGPAVPLDRFRGQPTVVNLWATWCPPCVREMPAFQNAQQRHPGVHFVFLNQGEDPARVAAWLKRQGLVLGNVLLDPQRQAGAAFQQQGYPTTLFFDAEGALVSTRLGEVSAATLDEKLQALTR